MAKKPIAIGADHAGVELKNQLKQDLAAAGYEVLDLGTDGPASVDYPDYAAKVAEAVAEGRAQKGVLVCGSGIGMSIAANRNPKVRAALVHDALGARLSRQHNDANVVCFGSRLTGVEVVRDALKAFLATDFEGGRHARRVEKMSRG